MDELSVRQREILQAIIEDYISNDRIIDAHVKNLRKKLPNNYIKTVIEYKKIEDDSSKQEDVIIFFKKKIKSRFINSLLYYVPYAVLSAMTFPAIFYATNNVYSALVGTVVALIASISKRSLVIVAVCSVLAVLLSEVIITFIIL